MPSNYPQARTIQRAVSTVRKALYTAYALGV
nr:MAG TPA: Protein of unknown function (DUF1340) [Caudoviricetes sp.]